LPFIEVLFLHILPGNSGHAWPAGLPLVSMWADPSPARQCLSIAVISPTVLLRSGPWSAVKARNKAASSVTNYPSPCMDVFNQPPCAVQGSLSWAISAVASFITLLPAPATCTQCH